MFITFYSQLYSTFTLTFVLVALGAKQIPFLQVPKEVCCSNILHKQKFKYKKKLQSLKQFYNTILITW